MSWRLTRTHETYLEMTNMQTGVVKRVPLASDKQFAYLQSLRQEAGKDPLKNRPTVFAAKKAIDKLIEKTRQQRLV